ncbi:MAG: hypothetical protein KA801_13140, partial [Syntrophorhabdaceae bacterium]|nr:hypothetical protein [Syntrophorhabdaceae bacterium]
TLTRRGMPLIRYRTGDISHFMAEPCPCGSVLGRLGTVAGRLDGRVPLGKDHFLTIIELDESLFPIEGLINYSAEIVRGDGKDRLVLFLYTGGSTDLKIAEAAREAASSIPCVREAITKGLLEVPLPSFSAGNQFTTGVGKRRIRTGNDNG